MELRDAEGTLIDGATAGNGVSPVTIDMTGLPEGDYTLRVAHQNAEANPTPTGYEIDLEPVGGGTTVIDLAGGTRASLDLA
ncbi:MAG: hypothetical protein ACRDH5_03760, partial [bacterium]